MSTDYSSWPIAKLKKEAAKIEKAIKTKESRERKDVLAELKAVARRSGFDLKELVKTDASGSSKPVKSTGKRKTKKRAPAKVKYKNPANPSDTWTGRGRKPNWVTAHLAKGGQLDDLSV